MKERKNIYPVKEWFKTSIKRETEKKITVSIKTRVVWRNLAMMTNT